MLVTTGAKRVNSMRHVLVIIIIIIQFMPCVFQINILQSRRRIDILDTVLFVVVFFCFDFDFCFKKTLVQQHLGIHNNCITD